MAETDLTRAKRQLTIPIMLQGTIIAFRAHPNTHYALAPDTLHCGVIMTTQRLTYGRAVRHHVLPLHLAVDQPEQSGALTENMSVVIHGRNMNAMAMLPYFQTVFAENILGAIGRVEKRHLETVIPRLEEFLRGHQVLPTASELKWMRDMGDIGQVPVGQVAGLLDYGKIIWTTFVHQDGTSKTRPHIILTRNNLFAETGFALTVPLTTNRKNAYGTLAAARRSGPNHKAGQPFNHLAAVKMRRSVPYEHFFGEAAQDVLGITIDNIMASISPSHYAQLMQQAPNHLGPDILPSSGHQPNLQP